MTAADTTTDAPAEPADARPRAGRRRRRFAVVLLVLVALLVAAGAAAAGAAVAWDASYAGRILPGVRAGTVDLSGLDREQAREALLAAYPFDQGSVLLQLPTGDLAIPYAAFGRRLDVDAMLDEALAAGRGGDLLARLPAEIRVAMDGLAIEPRLAFEAAALARAIERAVLPLAVDPVDATITMGPDGPVLTAGRDGAAVDPGPAVSTATGLVSALDAPAEVRVPVQTSPVPPRLGDDAVARAAARAEAMTRDLELRWRKKSWTIPADAVRAWIRFTPRPSGWVAVTVDPEPIEAASRRARKAVAKPAASAFYLKAKNGRVVGVAPGMPGRQLDEAATARLVIAELAGRIEGRAPAAVKVAWKAVEPKLTTREATEARGVPVLTKLGTWTTWFPISERNYFGANIWLPAEIINGTVLSPGESFEWWSALGPVTAARGFGPGGFIGASRTDPTGALGGGMCSSSTTLFNAALRAGLRINARSNHKYYIDRYPLGLDATVSISANGRQTLSFTNDTAHPILIRGLRTRGGGGRGYVTYELWGIPDGRTVTIGRPSVSNVIRATTEIEYVDTLPKGVREQVEYPSDRMDVGVTRVVRNAGGRVIHQDTWYSRYVLWPGLIQVGV